MKLKLEIEKRRPESIEELGVYMQGLEEGAKAAARVQVELLGNKNKPHAKRRRI